MKNTFLILALTFIHHFSYSQRPMEKVQIDTEIKSLTEELIRRGTQYDLEYLENIYDEGLVFTRIDRNKHVTVLGKEDNMNFFRNLKNSNAAPLNSHAEIHYADNNGESGFILLTRKMQQTDREEEYLFNIYWQKKNGQWKIIRESVIQK